MDFASASSTPRSTDWLLRILLFICGVDEETLRKCPDRDWVTIRTLGLVRIFGWVYLIGAFSLMLHRVFAAPGEIRPTLVLISAFVASFLTAIDTYLLFRGSWASSGIGALRQKGGLDISGGLLARSLEYVYLVLRLVLISLPLSVLVGVALSLVVFSHEIDARIDKTYQRENAALIAVQTRVVDGEIQRATGAVNSETSRIDGLSGQVAALRQREISGDPEAQEALNEVDRITGEKATADRDALAAGAFAADEGGGIVGAPGNSGRVGRGARYLAAKEKEKLAIDRSQALARELTAARARLDALRAKAPAQTDAARQQSHDDRVALEQTLESETTKFAALKNGLAMLIANREAAIRRAVEASAEYVPADNGFLTQMRILEQIGHEDWTIAWIIIAFDLLAFGLELAPVIGKVLSNVSTTYALRQARDEYMGAVATADEISAELERRDQPKAPPNFYFPNGRGPDDLASSPANDNAPQPANDNGTKSSKRRWKRRKYPLPPGFTNANGQDKKG
jgi:Domain of unknown function (DUF4407)